MHSNLNPFEYDQAINLSNQDILDYYIQDHNYSRFIESTRNVFLIGERGSGKTMTLLYHSFSIQLQKHKKDEKIKHFDKIGVYIPCNTPLFHKKEHELIESNKYKQAVISEHFFVLTIGYYIVDTLSKVSEYASKKVSEDLKRDFEYIIGEKLPASKHFFESVKMFIQKHNKASQEVLNQEGVDEFYKTPLSFYSFIIPLLNLTKKISAFKSAHFLFLIDDVQDLNEFQVKALNSWIAFRNHSDFSFKVSAAKVRDTIFKTATGGTILEGHDFLMIDLEEPFQNKNSDFFKLATDIIERRLKRIGVELNPDDYFPTNPNFIKDLKVAEERVREMAVLKYGEKERKKIGDFVYKYKRADYFKNRSTKTNRPTYSGFETIIHLSTGVIRNLLYPCYWMYDKAKSNSKTGRIEVISPAIQDSVIKEKSGELWNRIEHDLANSVAECSTAQAENINNLFKQLAILFKSRLKLDISEPRAITFTISGYSEEARHELEPLFRISREAQILYTRTGSSKDDGQREKYYAPNRLLFPEYGLDVIGQFSRVSIPAKNLILAAKKGKKINFKVDDKQNGGLFSWKEI